MKRYIQLIIVLIISTVLFTACQREQKITHEKIEFSGKAIERYSTISGGAHRLTYTVNKINPDKTLERRIFTAIERSSVIFDVEEGENNWIEIRYVGGEFIPRKLILHLSSEEDIVPGR